MSHMDLKSSESFVPAGSDAASGIARSKLCPPLSVEQPKSLPERDHQVCDADALSPVSNLAGSSSTRPGSLATYICEFCTRPTPPCPSVRVYDVPAGVCHVMAFVSCLESVMPDSVRSESSTSGTTQPSSCRPKASMWCDLLVAI